MGEAIWRMEMGVIAGYGEIKNLITLNFTLAEYNNEENYYFITSLLMLLMSVVAFSENLLTDVGQKSNSDPPIYYSRFILFCMVYYAGCAKRFYPQQKL